MMVDGAGRGSVWRKRLVRGEVGRVGYLGLVGLVGAAWLVLGEGAWLVGGVLVLLWGTAMRLRSAGLPTWWAYGVLVPKANLFVVLFTLLARPRGSADRADGEVVRWIRERDETLAKSLGVALTLLVCGAGFYLTATRYSEYGELLFLLIPFVGGFLSAFVATLSGRKTLGECCGIAAITMVVGMTLFLACGVEGVICILMAAPLLSAPLLIGAAVAYFLQYSEDAREQRTPMLSSVLAYLPLVAVVSAQTEQPPPPLRTVTTSLVIHAPPEVVWRNVVAFNELDAPDELIFRAGIAYPVRAEIEGTGVGAVRHCVFSTGAFVEPITAWEEPRLLAFDVTENPPTMDELSPYDIHPAHLEGHFTSERGQFLLVDLGEGRTRLDGTTWYRQSFGPRAYWGLWSDRIIHTIHNRVLRHIKSNAEEA